MSKTNARRKYYAHNKEQGKGKRYYKDKDFDKSKRAKADEEAVVKKEIGASMSNDPNWYFTNAEVANQAAQLSFQSYLGVEGTINKFTMPTIMTLHMSPSPGNTYPDSPFELGMKSGFNMSMTRLYNRLSMKSGRNMAYQPQDVGMAVLGLGELLSMISYARRLFGTVKWWNVRNRMVPKKIIAAMGIDPDDFFERFSEYRMRLNTMILACNQIPIMTNCGYLRKCASLYDNIYMDCDTGMCQYYIYVPGNTWILDEVSDQRGTVAKTTDVVMPHDTGSADRRTFDNFLTTILGPMITALLTSSTLNLVYADILNLNKTEDMSIATIDVVSEDYAIMPIHDTMVLKQIHNTTVMHVTREFATETSKGTVYNDVVCDPDHNCIKYSPVLFLHDGVWSNNPDVTKFNYIIDTDNSNPDIAEKIEVTRYLSTMGYGVISLTSLTGCLYTALPDHYCVGMTIYTSDVDNAHASYLASFNFDNDEYNLKKLALLSEFDWHPIIYHINHNDNDGWYYDGIVGDLNSFTIVDNTYMRRLNDIIYMGLFEMR